MSMSQMKNIVVLKNIPSNIVDEAIVILKNNINTKKKQTAERGNAKKIEEIQNNNYEFILKEAENVIKDYVERIEKPKETRNNLNKIMLKYRKLQIYSFLLGLMAIISILTNIIK